MDKNSRIVFMGTPEFAVASLDALVTDGWHVAAVVTAPDKPSGRGLQVQQPAVKKYAVEKNIPVLQPVKLKDPEFINRLKEIKADVQVVVAFRMLPEIVWKMPPKGTFNLHASLLPDYRGAAPINWAIINGERETGVTTFFIEQEIDTGNIIFQDRVSIGEKENAGELHDRLMVTGAKLVLKTIKAIAGGEVKTQPQNIFIKETALKTAPKIFKEDCRINWRKSGKEIYDFIRGLSPYPTAFTELILPQDRKLLLKVFSAGFENSNTQEPPGTIISDKKTFLKIAARDGYIDLQDVQLSGKNRMKITDFLKGFKVENVLVRH